MKASSIWIVFSLLVCAGALNAGAQEPAAPTPLVQLLEEARQKNPALLAALHQQSAASHVPRQAGALPDTQVMVQQLNVGSPRPFAGYTNSDFAYIGLGAAQEFPWPGKRALRSQVAELEAGSSRAQTEVVKRGIEEQIKIVYFRLAYLQQTLTILLRNDKVLGQMEQVAESRYRVGQGSQQEVLKAQLQHTKILQDINLIHREQGQLQAQLKLALGRAQTSPDIVTEVLRERALPADTQALLGQVSEGNAEVAVRRQMELKSAKQTELANKEFRPDMGVQFMYQNTDRQFRDYYMFTFSMTLPNRGRRKAELALAQAQQQAASSELAAEVQRRAAQVKDQLVQAQTSAEQLRIYREGLIPQAEATFRAAMAAYQANRQDFETLLSSFLDVLKFEEEYQKELSEHEAALARLESLTGVTLP
ncbi:MAG TPA: TolC family protein [Terriglobales bacterium]|nr:TolC family protein [Terriglobales bacterium]